MLEQQQIIQIIFIIAQFQDISKKEYIGIEEFILFFEYLRETKFYGYILEDDSALSRGLDYQPETDQRFVYRGRIKDLGILTALAMLRMDVFLDENKGKEQENLVKSWWSKKSEVTKLKTMMKALEPDPVNSIVCLAIYLVFNLSNKSQLKGSDDTFKLPDDFMAKMLKPDFVY
jgi:hypothetical protein